MPQDPYQLLQVSQDASQEEVRVAYRRLLRRFHPDVYKGDPAVAALNTRLLNEAYETLSDPSARSSYDHLHHRHGPHPSASSHASASSEGPFDTPRSPPREHVHLRAEPHVGAESWRRSDDRQPQGHEPPRSSEPSPRSRVAPWLVREWDDSASRFRRYGKPRWRLARWERWMLLGFLAIPLTVLAGLFLIPVSTPFNFSVGSIGEGGAFDQLTCSYQEVFPAGDQVTFSWSWEVLSLPSPGNSSFPNPEATVWSPSNQPVLQSWALAGTYTFTSQGGAYNFIAGSCWSENSPVMNIQGSYVGPYF